MKRFIIKTENESGVPSWWEITAFQMKHGVSVNEVHRLYVAFKVKKRKKIKRLRLAVRSNPCDTCGHHHYVCGQVGGKEFNREVF